MNNEVNELSFLPQQNGTLPFKTLVMAPLLGSRELLEFEEPTKVTLENFDQVLRHFSPTVEVCIDNKRLCELMAVEQQTLVFNYLITSFSDFQPQAIINREPSLSALSQIIEQIHSKLQLDGMSFVGGNFDCGSIELPELNQDKIRRSELELLVCELELILSDVLNEILHQEDFQQLEAAWSGLHWLCKTAAESDSSTIDCVACNRDILWDDLFSSSDITDSQLYQMLFVNSIGQYGAVPYGVLMVDDYFSGYGQDLSLLKQITAVSSQAHVPVVTGTSPGMFDVESYPDLQNTSYVTETLSGPRFIKWRSFLGTEQASYLSLTLPRLLFRPAYTKHNQTLSWFSESIGDQHEACLWGNACYGFVTNLIRSFDEHGFCTFISGNEGGVLDVSEIAKDGEYFPIEIAFSEQKEAELISLGFNPICTRQYTNQLLFQSANSVRWGSLKLQHMAQTSDSIASAQMQYLFIVIRVIHCLKIIFRENIGSSINSGDLSTKLNRWLRQYVSDVESPSKQVRSQRPLRDGKVVVTDSGQHGWYEISIELVPHLKYLGNSVTINTSVPVIENAADGVM